MATSLTHNLWQFCTVFTELIKHCTDLLSINLLTTCLGNGTALKKKKNSKDTYDQNEHVTVEPVQGGHPNDVRKVTTPDRSTVTKVMSSPEQRPVKVVSLDRGSVTLVGWPLSTEKWPVLRGGRRGQV